MAQHETPTIPVKDLDLETLLAIAERVSSAGAVSLLKSSTGWACALKLVETTADEFAKLAWYQTPEEALVAAITAARQ